MLNFLILSFENGECMVILGCFSKHGSAYLTTVSSAGVAIDHHVTLLISCCNIVVENLCGIPFFALFHCRDLRLM